MNQRPQKISAFGFGRALIAASALSFLLSISAFAQTRGSATYSITAEVMDGGGGASSSSTYSNQGSFGEIGGVSSGAQGSLVAKNGYIGQLSNATGLVLSAPRFSLNEGGTLQLGAALLNDDLTQTTIPASSVSWSIVNGALMSVSSSGLAAAVPNVYQDSTAVVQGSYLSYSSQLVLTIVDSNPDDYGTYAGDGIPDSWQVAYFGINNPKGLANVDADGTGQTNLFKYLAGLDPLDPASRFVVLTESPPGQPNGMNILFGPIIPNRTYTVYGSTDLTSGLWAPVSGTVSDVDGVRTVTDPNAATRKFYRVQITAP